MSAETLRRAAAQIRNDRGDVMSRATQDGRRWLPVADLLDNEASLIEGTETSPDLYMPLNGARVDLLTVIARAYLGEGA